MTEKQRASGRDKVEKALVANDFLNGGLANADRRNAFETFVRGTNDMMNLADIEFTKTLRVQHDKEWIGRRVLEAGTEATTFTNNKEPDYDGGTTTLVKLTGQYKVSYEALVENIEGKGYQAGLTRRFMEKAAYDISDIAVNGDTSSIDTFYAKFNGFYKKSDDAYVIDAEGNTINRNIFYAGFEGLPREARRRKNQLKWFGNTLLQSNWRQVYGDRATLGGDSATRGIPQSPDGIDFMTCDEIAENLSVGYTSAKYGEHIGTVQDMFVLAATNNAITINVTIDGAASGNTALTATAGSYTAPELAAHLNAACATAGIAEVFHAYDGKLSVKTTKTGLTQIVEIVAVANSMYTTVGFTAASYEGAAASAAGTDTRGTYAWLTMPQNFKIYLLENFRTYWKYEQEEDEYVFTTHFFMNTRIIDPTAMVRVDNIRLMHH